MRAVPLLCHDAGTAVVIQWPVGDAPIAAAATAVLSLGDERAPTRGLGLGGGILVEDDEEDDDEEDDEEDGEALAAESHESEPRPPMGVSGVTGTRPGSFTYNPEPTRCRLSAIAAA